MKPPFGYFGAKTAAADKARTEVLWSNRPIGAALTLFDEVPA